MELKITSDKVLAAAEKCPTAKETLKTLFPEVFEEKLELYFRSFPIYKAGDVWIEPYGNEGLWLWAGVGYKIKWRLENYGGNYLLIPTKK